MPLVVALWLALVHALAITTSIHPSAVVAAWSGPTVGQGVTAEPRVRAGAALAPDEALRQALPVRSVSVARSTTPLLSGPPAAALATSPRLPDAPLFAAAVRARALGLSHAVSARGDVLPYFPTAPPLQG